MSQQLIKQIKRGNTDKISQLISEQTINWNTYDKKSGRNLLQLAIESDDRTILDMLLTAPGANPNSMDQKSKESTLQTAVLFNRPDFVEKLLSVGANPLQTNSQGESAVDTAITNNLIKILEVMIGKGLRLDNLKGEDGSALNMAIRSTKDETAMWLLNNPEYRPNFAAKDKRGNTCLLLAVKQNFPQLVSEILDRLEQSSMSELEKELVVNAQDQNGDTVLHIAHRNKYGSILALLQDKGKKLGLNSELKNSKRQSIHDIIEENNQQKQRQLQQVQKTKEQKKLRERQKQEQREREAERLEQQQRKKEEARQNLRQLQQQLMEQDALKQKKYRWTLLIVVIAAILLSYLWFEWQIRKKKQSVHVIQ